MATQKKQVLIRVQPETYEKLKFISDKNHRSASNQLEWLMLQFISEYESQNGKISLLDESDKVVQKIVGGKNQNQVLGVDLCDKCEIRRLKV